MTLKSGLNENLGSIFSFKFEHLNENLPMGPCVGGGVHQGACPHRAAPSRSCRGGGGAVVVVVVVVVVLLLLSPAAAQSSRSSRLWGTPR